MLDNPNVIYGFQDNNVYITGVTLQELDNHKNDHGEVGYNAREKLLVCLTEEEPNEDGLCQKIDFTMDKNDFTVSVDINKAHFGCICCKNEFLASDAYDDFFSFLAHNKADILLGMSECEFDLEDSREALTAKLAKGKLPMISDYILYMIYEIEHADKDAYLAAIKTSMPDIDVADIPIVEKYPMQAYIVVELFERYVQPILLKDEKSCGTHGDMQISELSQEIYIYKLNLVKGSKESEKCGAVVF